MHRVGAHGWRQGSGMKKLDRKIFRFGGDGQNGQARQCGQTQAPLLRVTARRFGQCFVRRDALEQLAPQIPPVARGLLLTRRHHVAAGVRHEVADDGRFDVHDFHAGS